MAQQQQQQPTAAAAGASKTSPRKFSEKIALLNKKEAEGTAEFEEIIKEVQATRSHSSASGPGPHQNQHHLENQDDQFRIEQVYEDLVKCVGQIEEDLGKAEPGQYAASQEHLTARSASAGSGGPCQILHYPPVQAAPANHFAEAGNFSGTTQQATFYSYPQPAAAAQPNHSICSNDDSNFSPAGTTHHQAGSAAAPETGCRARVTSFGSANQKYATATYCQQPLASSRYNPYPSEHARAISCRSKQAMYLAPSDKSWQKSCSDPTLHLPCAPIDNPISCSENQLAQTRPEVQASQQQQTLSFAAQNGSTCLTDNRKHIYRAPQVHYNGPQLSELPNIQICNIDDDQHQQRQHFQPTQPIQPVLKSCDLTGLPDLRSLQFSNSPPNYQTACPDHPTGPVQYGDDQHRTREQLCESLSSRAPANGGLWLNNSKVNNLLSGSERALGWPGKQPEQPQEGPDQYSNGNYIMRSRSHNCIDLLRKGQPNQAAYHNNDVCNNPSNILVASYQQNFQSPEEPYDQVRERSQAARYPDEQCAGYSLSSQLHADPLNNSGNGSGCVELSPASDSTDTPLSSINGADFSNSNNNNNININYINNEFLIRGNKMINQGLASDLMVDESSSSSSCPTTDQPQAYQGFEPAGSQAPEVGFYGCGELAYSQEQQYQQQEQQMLQERYSLPPQ